MFTEQGSAPESVHESALIIITMAEPCTGALWDIFPKLLKNQNKQKLRTGRELSSDNFLLINYKFLYLLHWEEMKMYNVNIEIMSNINGHQIIREMRIKLH